MDTKMTRKAMQAAYLEKWEQKGREKGQFGEEQRKERKQ